MPKVTLLTLGESINGRVVYPINDNNIAVVMDWVRKANTLGGIFVEYGRPDVDSFQVIDESKVCGILTDVTFVDSQVKANFAPHGPLGHFLFGAVSKLTGINFQIRASVSVLRTDNMLVSLNLNELVTWDFNPQPEVTQMSRRGFIKALALSNGFKLKEQPDGTMDLNPYVYDFAEALLREFDKL